MRLKLALLALPLALLAAFAVYFQRPQLGASPADGSTPGAPVTVAGQSATAAPSDSTASGVRMMDPSSPSAETTPTLLKAITTVGQGEAKVAPDVAHVNVGVRTRETTAQAAQEKNNQAMAAVIAAIKALGIDDKDIQTSGLSLWPVFERENVIGSYEAQNNVTVRVDIAKVGPLIDAAVAAGANNNLGVGFGLRDPSATTLQALEAATRDARARADAIARGLGVTIKEVQIAVEETTTPPVVMREAAMAADARLATSTPVQPGELTVTARVRVTYTY